MGTHNFAAFSNVQRDGRRKNPVKTIHRYELEELEGGVRCVPASGRAGGHVPSTCCMHNERAGGGGEHCAPSVPSVHGSSGDFMFVAEQQSRRAAAGCLRKRVGALD